MYVEPNPDHAAFRRRDWSPIYACAYSHAAKTASNEGPKLLALASESGTIKLVDTRYNATQHQSSAPGTYSTELYPHQNAIFDVQWDEADERLLTASGDQTGAVHRLGEGEVRRDAVLMGHTSSVKTCAWYDQNTVLTAGRDGNILIFDLRTTGHWSDSGGMDEQRYARARQGNGAGGYWDQGKINPVLIVRNAHGENCGKKVSARSAVRSVTSLLALKSDRNVIASGGSADGVVKFWDLRAQLASTRRIYVSESVNQTLDRTADRGKRSRGVVSLVEAKGNIYAMCNDARIHSHSIQSPQLALPTYYTHPTLNNSSFYLKLAVSPCENFLACGASEGRFVMWGIERDFLGKWDWTRGKGDEVVNAIQGVESGWGGHSRQVGAMDWAVDQQIDDIDVSSVGDPETAKNRSTTLTDLPPELIELVVIHLQLDLESSNGRSSNRYWASMIPYSAAIAGPNDPSAIYSMNSKRRRAEFYDVFHFSSICRYIKQVMTSFRPYKELYLEGAFHDFGESWGYGSSFPNGIFSGIRPVLDSLQSDSHVPLLTTDLF
ncbi:hypothetical protein QFC20_007191 [Naganishia adeliensis]|uniref:Uncharacterized protein n=1 Tax=Naganishia adeliensis TaxID=92952 RepID=A0ACC2V2J0_9TREE|nr:hypothetical protein QFC20_007191 [Naganishia adeliensis]